MWEVRRVQRSRLFYNYWLSAVWSPVRRSYLRDSIFVLNCSMYLQDLVVFRHGLGLLGSWWYVCEMYCFVWSENSSSKGCYWYIPSKCVRTEKCKKQARVICLDVSGGLKRDITPRKSILVYSAARNVKPTLTRHRMWRLSWSMLYQQSVDPLNHLLCSSSVVT